MNEVGNKERLEPTQGYGFDRAAVNHQKAAMACEARQSAKGVIRERARQLHAEADRLEALARALPEELPPAADQALWDLAIATRR